MANGDVVLNDKEFRHWALQDGTGATSNGAWVDAGPYRKEAALDVSGITTATVQIFGSNEKTKPADGTDGRQIGTDITANTYRDVGPLTRWVKAKISAFTTGTVRADLVASR